MRGLSLVTVVWLIAAAGCGRNEEPARPVSWYQQHEADMRAKTTWCVDDATRERTPDCLNAAEAKRRSLVGAQESLAPIDWGAAKSKP